jgi:hypothetical protein
MVEVLNNVVKANLTEIDRWRRQSMRFEDSVTIDWTASPPSKVTSDSELGVLFYLATDEKLHNASRIFVNNVGSEIPENVENVQDALLQYIHQGKFPEVATTETGARQHQKEAFAEFQEQLTATEDVLLGDESNGWSVNGNISARNLSVSEGSDSSGGGSRQYTGRGQQAEVYTIASVLDRISTWLECSPSGVMVRFKSRFKKLHKDQQSMDYKWHVESAWQSGLLEILDEIGEGSFKNWRANLSDKELSRLPIVRLLNITQEQGPGFDVIDPFGPLDTDLGTGLDAPQFSPVEVKAVGGTEPPFRFRFTTNEYRRCKAFVSESDHRYIIRLVDVPESGTSNWPAQTTFVTEKVLETPAEVDQLMEIERFDKVVKGGYMNMNLE